MTERGRESEMGRKTKSWENMEERRTDRLENVPPHLLRCPRNARLEKKRRREDLNAKSEDLKVK